MLHQNLETTIFFSWNWIVLMCCECKYVGDNIQFCSFVVVKYWADQYSIIGIITVVGRIIRESHIFVFILLFYKLISETCQYVIFAPFFIQFFGMQLKWNLRSLRSTSHARKRRIALFHAKLCNQVRSLDHIVVQNFSLLKI